MTQWINRTVVQAARNGTTSHTVNFPAASAGSLLVAVADGSVTSSTPTGWNLPSGGSAINNTGLYVWWKTASSGESSLTTTHNGSNYPAGFVVYEFPAGSTFLGSMANTGLSNSAACPDLTGLTGTNLTFGVVALGDNGGNNYISTAWSGTGSPVKDLDIGVGDSGTDGYGLSVAYVEANTASSFQPTGTITQGGGTSKEALTFAINVPLGVTASPSSITSGEAFGTPAGLPTLSAAPGAIGTGETLGAPATLPTLSAVPDGIGSGEAFGSSAAVIPLLVLPAGIASGEGVGVPASAASLIAEAAEVASGEAIGAAAAATTVTVLPGGVASGEALGVPAAVLPLTASPAGIASGQAFGSPTSTGWSGQTLTIQHREGGAWVERTGVPRVFSGGQWVPATAKYWTGSGWSAL